MTHLLTVHPYPEDFDPEYDIVDWDVECLAEKKPGVNCNTWWECKECRKVTDEAHARDDGLFIDELEDKAYERHVIHGEVHGLIDGMICTESTSCVLYELDTWGIDEYLQNGELEPGKYFIEFECNDGSIDYVSAFAKLEEDNG